jgi:hypothetical protein
MIEILAFIDVIGIVRVIFILWVVLKLMEFFLTEDEGKSTVKHHS